MKPDFESNRLLEEIFQEAVPDDFRAALLRHTVQRVRRKRRARKLAWTSLGVALFIGLTAVILNVLSPELPWIETRAPDSPAPIPAPAPQPAYDLVTSRPLDPAMIVETRAGTANVVNSWAGSVTVIATSSTERPYKAITDEELFKLLAGKLAALVRRGPGEAELIFLDTDEETSFLLQ
jgi:hypothetical protein